MTEELRAALDGERSARESLTQVVKSTLDELRRLLAELQKGSHG